MVHSVRADRAGEACEELTFARVLERSQEVSAQFTQFTLCRKDGKLPESLTDRVPKISKEELERQRLEKLERETYQKAFSSGEEAGRRAEEHKIAEHQRLLQETLRALDGLPERIFKASEAFLVETAICLTRALVKQELTLNREQILQRVGDVLSKVALQDSMTLYLHPEEAEAIHDQTTFQQLKVVPDPKLSRGSVRMESTFGGVDYDLSQQIANVEESLRSMLQSRVENLEEVEGDDNSVEHED